MCLNPIHIMNKSKRFQHGIDKPFLDVPCGHCKECEQDKQSSWIVRAIAEYNSCLAKGGFVWFPSLTYNNFYLPRWKDVENGFSCPVFDKEHFKSFRNKLRIYLKRAGYDCKDDKSIRYFYACEYGDEKGRSHLHCIIFVPFSINRVLFGKLVRKAWIYGFVRYSPLGREIQSPKGICYTMKYISKDSIYYDKYKIDDYLKLLRSKFEDGDLLERYKNKAKYRKFKRMLPHHCQSLGFGKDFELSDDDFIKGEINSDRLDLYEAKFTYKIPDYYYRKLLYNYDKLTGLYSVNDRGKAIFKRRFDLVLSDMECFFDSVLNDDYLNRYKILSNKNVTELNGFSSYDYFKRHFTTHDLSIYNLCFRSVPIDGNYYYYLQSLDEKSFFDEIENSCLYFYQHQKFKDGVTLNKETASLRYKDVEYLAFNDLDFFKYFENVISMIENIQADLSPLIEKADKINKINSNMQFGKLYYLVD